MTLQDQIKATLAKLPAIAFVDNHDKAQGDFPVILIRRGQMGFAPVFTRLTAKQLNDMDGTTPEQAEAMKAGSQFGWHVPLADPDYHRTNLGARRALWLKTWPKHCMACDGWGGKGYVEMHGFNHGNGEQIFEPCEAIADAAVCHRCGEEGLGEDGQGPCSQCGWNYDDGVPDLSNCEPGDPS